MRGMARLQEDILAGVLLVCCCHKCVPAASPPLPISSQERTRTASNPIPQHLSRWITLALTQEFSFPDAMRLWDSLLSDPAGRTDCLLRLCTAMLLHVRQQLLEVRDGFG